MVSLFGLLAEHTGDAFDFLSFAVGRRPSVRIGQSLLLLGGSSEYRFNPDICNIVLLLGGSLDPLGFGRSLPGPHALFPSSALLHFGSTGGVASIRGVEFFCGKK